MDKGFFFDIIAHNPLLFQAIANFNSAVIPPVPEEISAVAGLDAAALWRISAVRKHFKTAELQEAFWDFTEESRRLALVDEASLKKLQKLFGVAVHAEEIAQIVLRAEVLALRESLGEDIYDYAVHRGQYQLGGVSRHFCKEDLELPLLERIRKHGIWAMSLCSASWPESLRKIFEEKLEETLEWEKPSAEVRHVIWFGLKKILLKEVAPQWAPYFK
jgi:hypothetical protein